MMVPVTGTIRWLVGRETRLRWVHLILGGALLMPYYLLALVLLQLVKVPDTRATVVLVEFAAYGLALPIVAATAFMPFVRPLETAAARALLGPDAANLPTGPAGSWDTRRRAATWYVVHLAVGGLVSGLTLATVPFALGCIALPLLGTRGREAVSAYLGSWSGAAIPIGLGLLVVVVVALAAVGELFARSAGRLLGRSPTEELLALQTLARRLEERNRLARDLHDSVGHALSVVTVQAGAAGRVLDRDPEFVRRALGAIEETARTALADLDHVLGLLRDEKPLTVDRQPALRDLHRLIDTARAGGVEVVAELTGSVEQVPAVVSREAYRIVQEGLTNALRHAGTVPVRLRVDATGERLTLELVNPIGEAVTMPGGGRGLTGIAERVHVLEGQVDAGRVDGDWRLAVEIPL